MEKLKQHYALADIQTAFADPASLNRSFVSKQGADDLGMDDSEVVAVIQALTLADFEKSMTSIADHQGLAGCLQADCWRTNALREIHARCTSTLCF